MKQQYRRAEQTIRQQDIAVDFERLSVLRHPIAEAQIRLPPFAFHKDLRSFWTQHLHKAAPSAGMYFDWIRYWILHGSASAHYAHTLIFSSNPFLLLCSLLEQGAQQREHPPIKNNAYQMLHKPMALGIYQPQPFAWHSELLEDSTFCQFLSFALQQWSKRHTHLMIPASPISEQRMPLLEWMLQVLKELPTSIIWDAQTPFHLLFKEPFYINQPASNTHSYVRSQTLETEIRRLSTSFGLNYPLHSTHRYLFYEKTLWLTPPPVYPAQSPWHLEHQLSKNNKDIQLLFPTPQQHKNFAQHVADQVLQCLNLEPL